MTGARFRVLEGKYVSNLLVEITSWCVFAGVSEGAEYLYVFFFQNATESTLFADVPPTTGFTTSYLTAMLSSDTRSMKGALLRMSFGKKWSAGDTPLGGGTTGVDTTGV